MVDPQDIQRKARVLTRLLGRKYGVRGGGLRIRRKRAGRLLPRDVRRAVREVERAQGLIRHPRIAMQLDAGRIEAAYARACEHLHAVDPKDRVKGYVLGVLAVNAFNALVIATAVILLAWWQGWV
ncbi:hypothetical protein [Pseudaestuariivita atlantica]|uniref:Uncharacterized protein n=1 Tax=Pseudaestuariivita atlantica TaxID=1317121 RepID=A0A0L1JTT9_9RHOB|nr:hypothetical protein [Pseudaestuariivita atlantica]KNG95189.1 hypothetical protein ATO11_00640 [Pseudaestuariivita atlantica]